MKEPTIRSHPIGLVCFKWGEREKEKGRERKRGWGRGRERKRESASGREGEGTISISSRLLQIIVLKEKKLFQTDFFKNNKK